MHYVHIQMNLFERGNHWCHLVSTIRSTKCSMLKRSRDLNRLSNLTGKYLGFASVLAIFVWCGCGAARAELTVCNQSLDLLNVSLGYEDRGEFQTEGWWSVGANRCSEVVRQNLDSRYYYVYAEDVFGQPVLAGDISGCVDSERFVIRGTEDCWIRGHRNVRFLEIDTLSQERWTIFLKGGD